jgi:hypothetical protein
MVFQKKQGALSKNVSQIFYVRSYNDVSKETIIFKVLRFMLIQA